MTEVQYREQNDGIVWQAVNAQGNSIAQGGPFPSLLQAMNDAKRKEPYAHEERTGGSVGSGPHDSEQGSSESRHDDERGTLVPDDPNRGSEETA
jgi:hypothetical protein